MALKKLGDCLEIQNGHAFPSKQFDADLGMQLIRIRDLKNGFTTQMKFQGEYDQRFVVNKGDLLIGMDGEFVCHEWKGEPSLLNQRVCRLQISLQSCYPFRVLWHQQISQGD